MKLDDIFVPFPLNLLGIPFALRDEARARQRASEVDAAMLDAGRGAQAAEMQRLGLNPATLNPLTPAQRAETFAAIDRAQPPGTPGVLQQGNPALLLSNVEAFLHPDFDKFAERIGIGGEMRKLGPGEGLAQGRNVVARMPFEPKPLADGSLLTDESGNVLAENAPDLVVPEGGAYVGNGEVLFKNPKTFAPPAPPAPGSGFSIMKGPNGELVRVDKATGATEVVYGDPAAAGANTPQEIPIGTDAAIEIDPTADMSEGQRGRLEKTINRVQEIAWAEQNLDDLGNLLAKNPDMAGAWGRVRNFASRALDAGAQIAGAVTGNPPPQVTSSEERRAEEAARAQGMNPDEIKQRALGEIESVLSSADVDPEVRARAEAFYSDPSLRGLIGSLVWTSTYTYPRALYGSQRMAYQQIRDADARLNPERGLSAPEIISSIRDMKQQLRPLRDGYEGMLVTYPGVRVRRGVPRGTGAAPAQPARVTVPAEQLAPNAAASDGAVVEWVVDANGRLVPAK